MPNAANMSNTTGSDASSASSSAAGGSNALSWMGTIGQGASGLIEAITNLIMMGRESQSSKMARHKWEGMKQPAAEMLSSLYYNPVAERYAAPYTGAMRNLEAYNKPIRDPETGQLTYPEKPAWQAQSGMGTYKWAPSTAMQGLYSNYLNRQYGLSNQMAQTMVGQSLAPVRLGQIKGGLSSAGAATASQAQSGDLANAAMGVQAPAAIRAQDYGQNATKLAAFNLWRAQQLGNTIG